MRTSLHQWLPVTSKKICKWVLCLVVIKNYYRNLKVMLVTWNMGFFIAFNIAVSMVRCSGSHKNIFYWISSLTFSKVGPRRPIVSEFPLTWSFISKKRHHKCCRHFHPRLHKPILKVLLMYRYIVVATIYFSGRKFSQTRSCFRQGFHRCQKFKFILQMQLW